mmetsp:Transcript_27884/g.75355  ORF Transcript_27884/g.75355 Transcript_27884/m.75355 type:complete len:217 (-) Transcript_27884:292-942(-)
MAQPHLRGRSHANVKLDLKLFCGWLSGFGLFGSLCLQIVQVTHRVMLCVDPLGHGPLGALDDWACAVHGTLLQLARKSHRVEQHSIPLVRLHSKVVLCALRKAFVVPPVWSGHLCEHCLPAFFHGVQECQHGGIAVGSLGSILLVKEIVPVGLVLLTNFISQDLETLPMIYWRHGHIGNPSVNSLDDWILSSVEKHAHAGSDIIDLAPAVLRVHDT